MWTDAEISHIDKVELLEFHIRKRIVQNLHTIKHRAVGSNLPYSIDVSYFEPFPLLCPVLGIEIDWLADAKSNKGGPSDFSPSIDRLIPESGYIPGNVHLISMRANRLKSDGNLEDIRKVAAWLEECMRNKKDAPQSVHKNSVQRELDLTSSIYNPRLAYN